MTASEDNLNRGSISELYREYASTFFSFLLQDNGAGEGCRLNLLEHATQVSALPLVNNSAFPLLHGRVHKFSILLALHRPQAHLSYGQLILTSLDYLLRSNQLTNFLKFVFVCQLNF